MTIRSPFRFVPKAFADGTPWIALEPLEGQLLGEGLPSGLFGFDLPEGTSTAKAQKIADYLDENLSNLTFTAMPLE